MQLSEERLLSGRRNSVDCTNEQHIRDAEPELIVS
jgi:hypothetical protein